MNQDKFIKEVKELGLEINEKKLNQLEKYYEMLIEYNKVMNLTGITEKEEVYLKHFYDSLTIAKIIDLKAETNLCDIGTGAGFPGIVLKIFYPNLKITLIDSLNKRINFLNEVIKELNLKDIETVHSRVEDFGKNSKYRESFDIVTARAVSNLAVLSEYLVPLTKIGGNCICMKGNEIEEECNNAKNAIKILGGKISKIDTFKLPESNISRNIIVIQKTNKTPNKYPRKAGIPSKEPLK